MSGAREWRSGRPRSRSLLGREGTMQTESTIDTGFATHVGWRDADLNLRRIAKQRGGLDAEEARWLRVAAAVGLHRQYGYATLLEYLERVLGYAPRPARE